jgi:hypothetical protein
VTEGTTRLLETPEPPRAPFEQNVYEHPGNLAQATSRISPQALPTSRSLETNRQPANWLLIGSLLIASIALIATILFITLRNRTATTVTPPVVTRPQVPPAQPPPLPPVPPPPGTTQGSGINSAFVYPGAKTTMEVTDVTEGNMIQLHTSDSFEKVVNWYTEKLKPTQVVKQPSNVVLAGGEVTAIINAGGDGTDIMLTQGDD